jgi:hypothetical protein
MHIIQDIDCGSNAITCLEYKNVRSQFLKYYYYIYVPKESEPYKNKATHSGSNSILKRDRFFNSVLMTIPK